MAPARYSARKARGSVRAYVRVSMLSRETYAFSGKVAWHRVVLPDWRDRHRHHWVVAG